MRSFYVALVALTVPVVACGSDGGNGGGESAGGDSSAGRDLGEAVAEAPPGALVGQTDTDLEHWTEGEPWEPVTSTQRAYGGDVWSVVPGYPQAMNHCDSAQLRVSWRSLSGQLYAGLTTYALGDELEQSFATPEAPVEGVDSEGYVDVEAEEPATEGRLILNACEQPVFRTTEPNVLVDYVVEVTEHAPQV